MALEFAQNTSKPVPFTGARIFFGIKPPKDWQLNSILQKDPEFQALYIAWDNETDQECREQLRLKLLEYEAKVRKNLGITDEESEEV